MMPLLMGLDSLWWRLERLEHEHRPEAWRRPGYRYYDDFDDQEARTGRVQRVRGALFFSGVEAGSILAERLAGINLSAVLRILLDACKDVAVYWGGSVLAGGALGGAIGAFGGGVGALPGAAIGAGLGSQVGAWVLGILGLKALLEDLGTALPEALRHYERGIRLAWGPVRHWESADSVFMDQDQASREIARGHVVLMMAVLSALSAYLTRGPQRPGGAGAPPAGDPRKPPAGPQGGGLGGGQRGGAGQAPGAQAEGAAGGDDVGGEAAGRAADDAESVAQGRGGRIRVPAIKAIGGAPTKTSISSGSCGPFGETAAFPGGSRSYRPSEGRRLCVESRASGWWKQGQGVRVRLGLQEGQRR
jgi:hypothetical protein